MDLAFFAIMRFPLKSAKLVFIFFFFKKKLIVWSRHLFLFYFKRENKIINKNPKYDSLWKKAGLEKTESRSGGQVTYREGMMEA